MEKSHRVHAKYMFLFKAYIQWHKDLSLLSQTEDRFTIYWKIRNSNIDMGKSHRLPNTENIKTVEWRQYQRFWQNNILQNSVLKDESCWLNSVLKDSSCYWRTLVSFCSECFSSWVSCEFYFCPPGADPAANKESLVVVNFGNHSGAVWAGQIVEARDTVVSLGVTASSKAIVGLYRMYVAVAMGNGMQRTEKDPNTNFYLLFNPWNPGTPK